ncbi:DUF2213 domain-containing protein [Geminocystis sp. NIES-3709]|uniref:DUF2213 domain-containing protein n=1 Tax=Geminocystis sp. NIES-3709 TaxID=1617448 RepID=UPI0005FC8A03|nr:DUF2213 domain-containing protein [Geminocystis sp. NIES-3709]BAQ65530.1 phage protein [Geminocystis sp. NIES-3709]
MDEIRVDTGKIFKSEKTEEGYLRVWMTVSRVGDLVYRNDDGSSRTEYVGRETLFDKDSLNTVWGKPITQNHPRKNDQYILIDSKNTREFERGMTQQGMVVNQDFLTVVGVITDGELIKSVESGENQVSAGYKASIVDRGDGSFEQVNRRYNHFAVLPRGRAGENVKVHLDCFRTDIDDFEVKNDEGGKEMTVTVHLDGIGYQVEPTIATAIAQAQTKFDSQLKSLETEKAGLETKVSEVQAKLDKAEGELEATKLKLDEAIKQDSLSAEISARMDVWSEVLPSIKDKDQQFKTDYGLKVPDIKRAYLEKVHNRTDLKDKSDAYIDGLYEALKPNERTDAIDKTNKHFDQLNSMGKKKSNMVDLSEKRKNRPLPGMTK